MNEQSAGYEGDRYVSMLEGMAGEVASGLHHDWHSDTVAGQLRAVATFLREQFKTAQLAP